MSHILGRVSVRLLFLSVICVVTGASQAGRAAQLSRSACGCVGVGVGMGEGNTCAHAHPDAEAARRRACCHARPLLMTHTPHMALHSAHIRHRVEVSTLCCWWRRNDAHPHAAPPHFKLASVGLLGCTSLAASENE